MMRLIRSNRGDGLPLPGDNSVHQDLICKYDSATNARHAFSVSHCVGAGGGLHVVILPQCVARQLEQALAGIVGALHRRIVQYYAANPAVLREYPGLRLDFLGGEHASHRGK